MIYSICYVGSLPFLRGTGTSFSMFITERMKKMIHLSPEASEILLSAGITLFVYIVRRDIKQVRRNKWWE